MTSIGSKLKNFFAEVRRRVFRAALIYLVVAWVVVQMAEIVFPNLDLPEWTVTLVIALVAVCFPIMLALAWAYDIEPDGEVVKTPDAEAEAAGADAGADTAAGTAAPGAASADRERDTRITSLAVLPFADMSPEGDQEYFGDGIAEELLNAIIHCCPGTLQVPARTSSFAFKGKNLDIREIGERLGVDTVVEGSVRKSGDQLRVTVQLVDVRDGYHIWSDRYDRTMDDLFAIQDEIASSIATRVVELVGGEPADDSGQTPKRHTQDIEAYDLYLKGRFLWTKRTSDALMKGVEYFEQAIAIDPGYARAYAGLADSYSLLGWYRYLPTTEAFEQTKRAARTAVGLDDTLAEAYTSLAYAEFLYDWDWSGAERDFERAIRLNPSYPTVRHFYAEYLMAMGRFDEAYEQMLHGQRLDPLALGIATGVGWALYYLGRYEEAIEEYHNVQVLDPNFAILPWFLGPAYVKAGRYEEAIALYDRYMERSPHPGLAANRLQALWLSGRREEAERVRTELEERARTEPVPADYMALVYATVGEVAAACDALERAVEERCWSLVFLGVDPNFDSLRGEPRFQAILRSLALAAR